MDEKLSIPTDYSFFDAVKIYAVRLGVLFFVAAISLLPAGLLVGLKTGNYWWLLLSAILALLILITTRVIDNSMSVTYDHGRLIELVLSPGNKEIEAIDFLLLSLFFSIMAAPLFAAVVPDNSRLVTLVGALLGFAVALELSRLIYMRLGGHWESRDSLNIWLLSLLILVAGTVLNLVGILNEQDIIPFFVIAVVVSLSVLVAPIELLLVPRNIIDDDDVSPLRFSRYFPRLLIGSILGMFFLLVAPKIVSYFEPGREFRSIQFLLFTVFLILFATGWFRPLMKKLFGLLLGLINLLSKARERLVREIRIYSRLLLREDNPINWLRLSMKMSRNFILVSCIVIILLILLPFTIYVQVKQQTTT